MLNRFSTFCTNTSMFFLLTFFPWPGRSTCRLAVRAAAWPGMWPGGVPLHHCLGEAHPLQPQSAIETISRSTNQPPGWPLSQSARFRKLQSALASPILPRTHTALIPTTVALSQSPSQRPAPRTGSRPVDRPGRGKKLAKKVFVQNDVKHK